MQYKVTYLFGGCIIVDATSKDHATELVEDMADEELLHDVNLEIVDIEEVK